MNNAFSAEWQLLVKFFAILWLTCTLEMNCVGTVIGHIHHI